MRPLFSSEMLDEASAPLGAASGGQVDLDPPPLLAPSLLHSSGEKPSPTPETAGSRRFLLHRPLRFEQAPLCLTG